MATLRVDYNYWLLCKPIVSNIWTVLSSWSWQRHITMDAITRKHSNGIENELVNMPFDVDRIMISKRLKIDFVRIWNHRFILITIKYHHQHWFFTHCTCVSICFYAFRWNNLQDTAGYFKWKCKRKKKTTPLS